MPDTLEIAAAHLEWANITAAFTQHLVSPMMRMRTADEASSTVLDCATDPVEVEARLDELDALADMLAQSASAGGLGSALRRVEPIEDLLVRAGRASVLDLEEVAAVADVVLAAAAVHEMLEPPAGRELPSDPGLAAATVRLSSGLAPPGELATRLAHSIGRSDGEPVLLDTASPALGRLRRASEQANRALRSAADRIVGRAELADALSDRYWTEREGRVVLPVRSDGFARHVTPGKVAGIIHGSSASGRTLYVEPHALVEAGNTLRQAQMAVEAEERRLLMELSRSIGAVASELGGCVQALGRIDEVRARLLLSRRLEGVRPRVGRPGDDLQTLELPGVRHPSMLLRGDEVVPNDVVLGVGQALVVSGPNAGGKTVALKAAGLCVMMARAGLHVPTALPARVPLFRTIVTDVGDDQSIAASLSTFSAHIGHLEDALEHAQHDGVGTLVLLDEVAAGTDPEQGAALAEAVLDRLVELGATLIVTTHYERLKLLASRRPDRFVNASVGFELAELRPTFRLSIGAPGSSSALAVARRLGLSDEVLRRAESLLSDERLRVDELLREVEAERNTLIETRLALEREREQVREREARLDAREQAKLESMARRRIKAAEAATGELRALEDEIRRRRKALRESSTTPGGGGQPSDPDARAFAREARDRLGRMRPEPDKAPGAAPAQLEAGARVRVESFGAEGEVVAVKGERITVQLPGAKVTVSRDDLRPARAVASDRPRARVETPAKPSDAARHFGAEARPVREGIDNVVDLRGVRADEAVTMLEVFLDRAIADDLELVIVKHGYGSGALRKVVREHLPHLRHVARHRPGLPAEGGDAVTVVWVRG